MYNLPLELMKLRLYRCIFILYIYIIYNNLCHCNRVWNLCNENSSFCISFTHHHNSWLQMAQWFSLHPPPRIMPYNSSDFRQTEEYTRTLFSEYQICYVLLLYQLIPSALPIQQAMSAWFYLVLTFSNI